MDPSEAQSGAKSDEDERTSPEKCLPKEGDGAVSLDRPRDSRDPAEGYQSKDSSQITHYSGGVRRKSYSGAKTFFYKGSRRKSRDYSRGASDCDDSRGASDREDSRGESGREANSFFKAGSSNSNFAIIHSKSTQKDFSPEGLKNSEFSKNLNVHELTKKIKEFALRESAPEFVPAQNNSSIDSSNLPSSVAPGDSRYEYLRESPHDNNLKCVPVHEGCEFIGISPSVSLPSMFSSLVTLLDSPGGYDAYFVDNGYIFGCSSGVLPPLTLSSDIPSFAVISSRFASEHFPGYQSSATPRQEGDLPHYETAQQEEGDISLGQYSFTGGYGPDLSQESSSSPLFQGTPYIPDQFQYNRQFPNDGLSQESDTSVAGASQQDQPLANEGRMSSADFEDYMAEVRLSERLNRNLEIVHSPNLAEDLSNGTHDSSDLEVNRCDGSRSAGSSPGPNKQIYSMNSLPGSNVYRSSIVSQPQMPYRLVSRSVSDLLNAIIAEGSVRFGETRGISSIFGSTPPSRFGERRRLPSIFGAAAPASKLLTDIKENAERNCVRYTNYRRVPLNCLKARLDACRKLNSEAFRCKTSPEKLTSLQSTCDRIIAGENWQAGEFSKRYADLIARPFGHKKSNQSVDGFRKFHLSFLPSIFENDQRKLIQHEIPKSSKNPFQKKD